MVLLQSIVDGWDREFLFCFHNKFYKPTIIVFTLSFVLVSHGPYFFLFLHIYDAHLTLKTKSANFPTCQQGCSYSFQNEGQEGGLRGVDQDSKWQLSINPCTMCNFIWGLKETGLLTEGLKVPNTPSGYTPVSVPTHHTTSPDGSNNTISWQSRSMDVRRRPPHITKSWEFGFSIHYVSVFV